MSAFARTFLIPRANYNSSEQSRARIALLFADFFLLLNAISASISFLPFVTNIDLQSVLVTVGLIGITMNGFVILLVQVGRLRLATFVFLIYLLGVELLPIFQSGLDSNFLLTVSIPIIYVGLMFGARGVLLLDVLLSLELVAEAILETENNIHVVNGIPFTLILNIAVLAGISGLLAVFVNEEQRTRSYADRLVAQLRATAEVAQTTTTILELDELLKRTVDFIRDRFAFYHVQIFLIDEDRRFANLAASTSEVGEALLQRGHRLAVGSQSIIGRVTLLGTPLSADDTMSDPVHRVNELLPETRSELALPLIAGDQVIGALDVQSTRARAFSREDIDSLQIMATQVSIAIRNAQLFADQKKALSENRRLFLEAEGNLREIQRLNQRLTGEAWDDYLRVRRAPTLGFTLQDNQLHPDGEWTSGLTQALDKRRPILSSEGGHQSIAVPVELRGQAIGAIEIDVSNNVRQTDMLEMVQSVAQRLALSLDNARLFEQAQEVAQQELEVNAISAKIQGVTDVDDILRVALAELGRALGAERASVRLGANVLSAPPQASLIGSTTAFNGKAR